MSPQQQLELKASSCSHRILRSLGKHAVTECMQLAAVPQTRQQQCCSGVLCDHQCSVWLAKTAIKFQEPKATPSTPHHHQHQPLSLFPSPGLLLTGLGAPLCLKAAVDTLSAGGAAVLIPAVRWVLCFGLCGILQHLMKEVTYPTFTPVSQVGWLQQSDRSSSSCPTARLARTAANECIP